MLKVLFLDLRPFVLPVVLGSEGSEKGKRQRQQAIESYSLPDFHSHVPQSFFPSMCE